MPKGNLFIGTSGWVYGHWIGIFYPEDLPSKDKLKYFSQHFKTAEINYSFYHLPRPSSYQNWRKLTPEDFIFAVKASRFITHIKRLSGVKEAWQQFLENALYLKEKLGPILFQFPPSFRANEIEVKRIADSPSYPKAEEVTADFIYLRMHGSKVLFTSNYTKKELNSLSQGIKKWLKTADVYVYFNNDAYGYAIENAKELSKLCK